MMKWSMQLLLCVGSPATPSLVPPPPPLWCRLCPEPPLTPAGFLKSNGGYTTSNNSLHTHTIHPCCTAALRVSLLTHPQTTAAALGIMPRQRSGASCAAHIRSRINDETSCILTFSRLVP